MFTVSQFPQTFLTNSSKLGVYPWKIPTACDHRNVDSVNQALRTVYIFAAISSAIAFF